MAKKTLKRRAIRRTRPDTERFLSLMVVLSQRTFSWSLKKRTLMWGGAIAIGVYLLTMTGSAYGLWATKRLMSFSSLQRETARQQQQLRDSVAQAQALEGELNTIRQQLGDLMHLLNPRNPGPDLPPVPENGPKPPGDASQVSRLKADLERTAAQARLVKARMEPILSRWARTPSIQPTSGYLSSRYGLRISPFSRRNESDDGLLGFHQGIDITNQEGTPIMATADGTVTFAGWQDKYGQTVVIEHGNGLETLYSHLNLLSVQTGQEVSRGDILGGMGRSGNATGVHLHYEVRLQGRPVNPTPYLRLQRQWLNAFK